MNLIPDIQKAYVLTKDKGLILKHDIPVIKNVPPKHLLIKIMGCSVCGTDLGMLKREKDPWTFENVYPKMVEGKDLVFGHEFYGKVVLAGNETSTKLGEIGCSESHYPSPECLKQNIDGHTCKNYGIFGIWGHRNIDGTYAPVLGGGYSEYILIPEINFYPVGELYKTFHCSLIEPLGNTWMIAQDLVKRNIKNNLLIYGSGPHGLNLQIFAKHLGIKNIVAIEPNDFRREFSKTIGAANFCIKPEELTKDFTNTLTNNQGFEAVVDVAGYKSIIDSILENNLIKENGILGLFGLPKEAHRTILTNTSEINMNDFIFGRQEAKGKTNHDRIFTYVGYSGRTDIAFKTLISELNSKEKGKIMQNMLLKQLKILGPLDKLENMIKSGFPDNLNKNTLKIGFLPFN